jgi:hypothetical protein
VKRFLKFKVTYNGQSRLMVCLEFTLVGEEKPIWLIICRSKLVNQRIGVLFPAGAMIFLLPTASRLLLDSNQPHIQRIYDYCNIYPKRCNVKQFIYIWKLLYMFWLASPSIIRSAYNCFYSIWYLSHRYCYLPLSWKSWNCSAR